MEKVLKNRSKAALVLLFAAVLLLASTQLEAIKKSAEIEDVVVKSAATYAVVRGVNALVSVLKESQINIEPAGIGITLAAGQVLDPLDDLTERISTLLVYSILLFGLYGLVMEFGLVWLFYIGATATLLSLTGLLKGKRFLRFGNGMLKLSLAAAALTFILPLALHLNGIFYEKILLPNIEAKQERLKSLTSYTDIDEIDSRLYRKEMKQEEFWPDPGGIYTFLRSSYEDTKEYLKKIKTEFDKLKENLDEIVELLLSIGVLYFGGLMLQLFLLPFATLFLLYRIYSMRVDFY